MHRLFFLVTLALIAAGCGSQPPRPQSRREISWTSRNNTHLGLDPLPVEDYPALKKFYKLREVQFTFRAATDEKMEALAGVGLTNLYCVTMNGSSHITDRGIEALARIPSVHSLGLEGASITDAALETIASRMLPHSVNIASCSNITFNGLLKLARASTLKDFGFSSDRLTTTDVVHLLDASQSLERFQITGPSGHLDRSAIHNAADKKTQLQGKHLQIVFQPKGSISMTFPLREK